MRIIIGILLSLFSGFVATLIQIVLIFAPFVISGILLHIIGIAFYFRSMQIFGSRMPIYILGMIGTIIHEGSHAIGAILFGHQIVSISFFEPNDDTGEMGYCQTACDLSNGWHQFGMFFSGVAPLLMVGVTFCLLGWMLGFNDLVTSPWKAAGVVVEAEGDLLGTLCQQKNILISGFKSFFTIENMMNWKFWIFCYLIVSIGSQCGLSGPDCHSCGTGIGPFFSVIVLLLLFINICASLIAVFDKSVSYTLISILLLVTKEVFQITYIFIAVLIFPFVFAVILCALLLLPVNVIGIIFGKIMHREFYVSPGAFDKGTSSILQLGGQTIAMNFREFFEGLEESDIS